MRLFSPAIVSAAVALVLFGAPSTAQEVVDGFQAGSFTARDGKTMPYRLFMPDARARAQPLPIVIYLHGSGGVGTDNLKQMSGGNTNGTHVWTRPEMQARHPVYVLAPQLPEGEQWGIPDSDDLAPYAAVMLELVESLSKQLRIDTGRLYLTGQSRGGRGTWDIVSKRPHIFAAAVPLCGDGSSSRIVAARDLPIWAFHGAKDEVLPVSGSRDLVKALRAVGSPVKYTEYPDAGHNVWTLAYVERELPEWLFSQRRGRR